jgi:phage virion morphogenesis protein
MLDIELDDAQFRAAWQQLHRHCADLGPVLKDIGEDLVESTKQRFADSKGPDGSVWPANSSVTIARMVHSVKGTKTKDGFLSKKGEQRWDSKKPLIGESRRLSEEIHYQLHGNTLEIGSNMEYAAMQQFGGKKSKFPHLWGDIPARPFLGLSAADKAGIVEMVSRYLEP